MGVGDFFKRVKVFVGDSVDRVGSVGLGYFGDGGHV